METSMTCPRCGDEFTGDDANAIADAVLKHAKIEHNHALDRHVVLAHLAGVRPDEYEG